MRVYSTVTGSTGNWTDSPDILAGLMELHKDWEQFGGPWSGQDG